MIQLQHPSCQVLFKKPVTGPVTEDDTQTQCGMNPKPSHNKLGTMMSEICKRGGLPKTNTNYCLCDTFVTILDKNVDARHIMSMSQHRSAICKVNLYLVMY